jgi:hypothetical protein
VNYSLKLNLNRVFTLTNTYSDNFLTEHEVIFFSDGLVISTRKELFTASRLESTLGADCLPTQNMSKLNLNYLYNYESWGLYQISNDTLFMQLFNGNKKFMLSDFFSLTTYSFQVISRDSLRFLHRKVFKGNAIDNVKDVKITSVECNHNLTSDKAWIKREKWLYCKNK